MTKTKEVKKRVSSGGASSTPIWDFNSRKERLAAGEALREAVPREHHAAWKPTAKRRDPIDVLEESNRDRVPELVPIRYGRMLRSPFTFLRGSAGLMAYDLASTPATGLRVQACGDCHLLNFGLFATPERNLVFDINDFDETLPAPWEWDIKRLGASFSVAARDKGFSDKEALALALSCAQAYALICGSVLARAHAKSGDAAKISGYLGKSDAFDQAIGEFSLAYADQTVRDHAALVNAYKKGRIKALIEEDL